MEGQLRGTAQDVCGLLRVLHPGQFDEDAVVAGADKGGFGDAERVDAAAQHLQGAVGGRAVGVGGGGGPGLEHDLGAAPQVESEADRHGDGDVQRYGDHGEGEQRPHPQGTGQRVPPAGTPRPRRRPERAPPGAR